MDDRLKQEMRQVARDLAARHHGRLAEAGTFLEIEELTAGIGDELARHLASGELGRRAEQAAAKPAHPCPDCGREAPVEPDPEPVILQGTRGEIEYQEPRCHCSRCRRDFFPAGRPIGASAP